MIIPLVKLATILVILIPITAIIDYFAFKKRFKELYGKEMNIFYFFIPCFLEISMFILGCYVGVLWL